MPAVFCVAYRKGSEVDVDHYVPWALGPWKPFAKSYHVFNTPAEDSLWEVIVILDFESEGDVAKAMGAVDEATHKTLTEDWKNFSKRPAESGIMEVKGTSS